ncbi:Xaa-Pro dipeptidase [Tistlia consotensis]|uniref:Xaa-Pro dipeptidase n=1 Tax=Tistlia consotensis USBA 355 TaxID=560819 RepID=A0A1Y6CRA6_9PROT|nr:M24 family metallopeptidase [Tistlia consotensis]SMF82580.1 Xaa-Pro dipeptidase [Tistlia consotensis USBA 355]SNS29430.1 Xaa-Pro dipeptidase [Tistlia consotensis]
MATFEQAEYEARIARTKAEMAARGLDALVVTDVANMHWLTGYDGWSFYTPQCVVIGQELEQPLWIGRGIDVNGARVTTFLKPEHIHPYPDDYVQTPLKHPMGWAGQVLEGYGLGGKRIGVETDSYYFSPRALGALQGALPNASFQDADLLVNWLRIVKSPAEIALMQQAGEIMDLVMSTAIESIDPGVRQCDAAAAIYRAAVSGTPEFGGDYPAIVPMLPTGLGTSTPHLTWSDAPFRSGEATILELAGCRLRYHCPQARTLFLGSPPQRLAEAAKWVVEGIEAALAAARPGATAEAVERAWRETVARGGLLKESRIGYSCGLNYPPDWGEHTLSLRPGDTTELKPDMTIHLIPGIWQDDWGIEISECFRVIERGAEPFCTTPRELIVKR